MCTRNLRSKRRSENFHEFLRYSTEICFRTATSPNLTFLQLEVLLGTKNEVKMIRRGHYSSNNFQDSTKIKSTEKKIVGVLDTGVSRSTCSWAPSTAQLRPRGRPTIEAQRRRPS
jgi:hypothetical protein